MTLVLWGLATLLTLTLLARAVVFRQYEKFPLFFLYLAINLLQTAVGIALYQGYGFRSVVVYKIAWTTQGIVVVARALAGAEVCHLVLGKYKGIWALAGRMLSGCGLLVLCLALYFGRSSYQSGVITLEIGLEACIATGIAGLFLFARYYDIPIASETGLLGLGLGLFSSSTILNDLVFERLSRLHSSAWNHVSSGAFVGILLIWMWALRKPFAVKLPEPALRPALVYANLIPQVNRRLAELNEQLAQLWRVESPKS
jgi:hypothetical protein